MARHRRRRRYHGYITVPGLAGLKDYNPFGRHVQSTDVMVGAVGGLAVGALVKYALNKANVALGGKMPGFVMTYLAPISTFLGGVALYAVQKNVLKKSGKLFGSNHAEGHLAGAAVAAFAPIAWSLLGQYGPKMADGTPFFSDYVMTNFGLLQADQPFGLLTADGVQARFRGAEDWDPMSAP